MKTTASCIALITIALMGTSCKKKLIEGMYEGQPISMGNGKCWSWVKFDKEGNTECMGFSLTDGALDNLPSAPTHTNGNHAENVFEMQFPPETVSGTPFTHCVINWNSVGHTAPFYDKPHLDMHFYLMSHDERLSIPAYPEQQEKFENYPASPYLPANYIVPGPPGGGAVAAAEPAMGTHWVDSTSAELKGGTFTQTFVYGSWDGKVVFYEPMITYSFLKSITTEFSRDIPQPSRVQHSGHYPRRMLVTHADGQYNVSLQDFYYRKAE